MCGGGGGGGRACARVWVVVGGSAREPLLKELGENKDGFHHKGKGVQ